MFITTLLLFGCSEQEFNFQYVPPAPGDLSIQGRVCDPIRQTWLEGAFVYTNLYDEDNDVVYDTRTDTTDADGIYVLDALNGDLEYEIYVQMGHDIIDQFIVTLSREADLVLPDPPCFADVDAQVVVITGTYDDLVPTLAAANVPVARVIDGQRGDELVDFLSDVANLVEYDILFFDGGHQEDGVVHGAGPAVTSVQDSLRTYVEQGGVIFASDWAYDVVERLYPEKVEWVGDDAVADAAQAGEPGDVTANVTNSGLSLAVGQDTVTVRYDLAEWPVIEVVDATVDVYLQGDVVWRQGMSTYPVADAPVLIGFEQGSGNVIYSTYRAAANADGNMLAVLAAMVESVD